MSDYDKPPLGCSPSYVTSGSRIKELADAISRTAVEAEHYTGHISMWAEEIMMQCNIISYFQDKEANDDRL